MKRIQSAAIFQTLVFSQKPELGFSREQALVANYQEIVRFKAMLGRSNTRYVIVDTAEQKDGSIVIHIRKQYNERVDTLEYFNEGV